MTQNQENNAPQSRWGRAIFALMAMAMLLVGAALYLFRDWWGLDQGTATIMAVAFLIVGLADLLILKNWDRLFAARANDQDHTG